MSTELLPAKPRRASSPLRVPFRVDSAELRRQAANMLHAFAERLQNELARQGILPPPAIELWLMYSSNFACATTTPMPMISWLCWKPRLITCTSKPGTLYELLECANSGALAQDSHLHIGLSSAGPVAFLRALRPQPHWRPRNRPSGKRLGMRWAGNYAERAFTATPPHRQTNTRRRTRF